MTRVEKTTEEPAVSQPEILDIGNYGGLYGRLLLASQSSEAGVNNIINPAIKRVVEPSQITISEVRDYNPITERLSDDERVDAWKNVEFTDAYAKWRTKLTKSIKSTTDEKRIQAIAVISGKLASEFSEEDADNLYNAFCKGKSDTTGFAKSIVANLQKDEKADPLWLTTLSPGIEWFSGSLFGKETAVTVLRMIELETEITNNPTEVVQKIFSDKERVNNLTEQETKILTKLYGGLNAIKIKTESTDKPDSEPTANKGILSKGHRIQHQGKLYTISDIDADNVHLLDPNNQPRTLTRNYLEELLTDPYSPWKLLNEEGGIITLPKIDPEGIDDRNLAPAPVDKDKVPAGTFYADETPTIPADPKPESRGKVILLESSEADFIKELNANLLSQTETDTTFSIPVGTLRRYLASVAGNKLIYSGNLTVNKDKNEIVINGLKIDGGFMAGEITINLSIINTSKGIDAQVTNYEGRTYARRTVEQQIASLNSKFREIIDAEVAEQNSAWKSSNVTIAEDRILVGFHDTRSTAGNLPA
jgi:hypothetical protein